MRGAMKLMTRTGIYKASNVTFNPDTCQALSYAWWRFVDVINGKVVFNNIYYSQTTCKHQSKVRSLLSEKGINIDFIVQSRSGLQQDSWKEESVTRLKYDITVLESSLASPRRKKSLDAERTVSLNDLNLRLVELTEFINTIKDN